MSLTKQHKQKIRTAMLAARKNYGGSDNAYAKTQGVNPSIFSRIKKGELDNVTSDTNWINIGRMHNVNFSDNSWKIARTEVYNQIEENLRHCQNFSSSMILVDTWGIGKTECAKHIAKQLKNAFYIDASQCKTKIKFTRTLARVIGLDSNGLYNDLKENIKYYLKDILNNPIIIVDEAGDCEYSTFLDLKEYWNGTENQCAWYMMGDDSLQNKIDKGIERKKVGFGSVFSRYSGEYITLTPVDPSERQKFLGKLLTDVAEINSNDKTKIPKYVKNSLEEEQTLRYLKNLIQVNE